jgi:Fur family transcriptional regulator, stress-responsive regulator
VSNSGRRRTASRAKHNSAIACGSESDRPVKVSSRPSSRHHRGLDKVQNQTNTGIVPEGELADSTGILRRHGVQVTAQRLAVMKAVARRPHGTTDEIEEFVRAEIGAVSRQAVYDALGVLTDKGLIRRIQPARSPARYEDRVDDNHHHLVCRGCGVTVDVACAVGYTPCLEAAEDNGFIVDEAEVIYWGTCPLCQRVGEDSP